MPRMTSAPVLLTGLALSIAASSGCYREGGNLWSNDAHVYVSTSWQPKTIAIVDTRTEETLWTMDIPVGQQLVIAFDEDDGRGELTPARMEYGLMDAESWSGSLDEEIDVPSKYNRRIDMVLRAAPEMPMAATDRSARPSDAATRPARPAEAPPPRQPAMEVGG